jgi:predicted RNase H-like nuclease (RuvC/YqgF family)
MPKPLIIGYDPGTTAALAILDTGKNVLYLKSKKDFKKKELFEAITQKGKPIIVSADKNPLPKSVEKLASSLGCKTFEPSDDLSNLEKYKLVKNYLDIVKNDHERDALASALKAHKKYQSLFRKTDKTISYLGLSEFYDKILKVLIQDEAENINQAVNSVLGEIRKNRKKNIKKKKEPEENITPEKVKELRKRIRGLKNDVKILSDYNKTLKKRLEKVDQKFREQKKKAENFHSEETAKENGRIHRIETELEKTRIVIEKLKMFRLLEKNDYIPIIELERIKSDKLRLLDRLFDLEDRVLMTNSFMNIRLLNHYNIRALIVPNTPDKEIIQIISFPIIPKDEVDLKEENEVLVAQKKEFDEKIKKARKSGFIQWVNKHKERRI